MGLTTGAHPSRRHRPKRRRLANLLPPNPSCCEMLEDRLLLAVIDVPGGDIANGTIWHAGDIQHITGNLHIPTGSTLTIEAGAIVKFNSGGDLKLLVDGTLLAQGTAQLPIVFTSTDDDTGRDGILGTADDNDTNNNGSSTANPGQWESINFSARSRSPSILDHVDIRFAGENAAGAIVTAGPLTISNSTIRDCSSSGIRITASNPTISQDKFIRNGLSFTGAAISMDLASNPTITSPTLSNNRTNGVLVDGGTLTQDGVWDDVDIVYRMSGNVTVPAGRTLTIAAGQFVKFNAGGDQKLQVDGTLLAQGTAQKPILFTTTDDDTGQDGVLGTGDDNDTNNNGSSTANPGQWESINFSARSGSPSILDHVDIRFAGENAAGAIVTAGPLTISNSTIRDCSSSGIRITASNPTISQDTFIRNGLSFTGAAISMDLASNPTITSPTLSNNRTNGVLVDGGTLTQDGVWDDVDIVYRMSGNVTVPAGRTLTIAAGQ